MAKDMTRTPPGGPRRRAQRGFSLVELLVAAAILAAGLLGLAMLQAMSIKASRGSANAVAAALLAGQIMDRAELEGRLSWLNATASNRVSPSLDDLYGFNLKYITIKSGERLEEAFDVNGGPVGPKARNDASAPVFFKTTTRREPVPAAGEPGSVGRMSDMSVRVEFVDGVGRDNKATARVISLTRRIVHG
jgi:prepilin-type N-terminal cleavage/methylation domain-containing protein